MSQFDQATTTDSPPVSPRSSTSESSSVGSSSSQQTDHFPISSNGDEKQCIIMYEALMDCEKARQVFGEFLREDALNEEPMLFLQDLASYEASYEEVKQLFKSNSNSISTSATSKIPQKSIDAIKKLRTKAKGIIERFIEEGSVKELNLGSEN